MTHAPTLSRRALLAAALALAPLSAAHASGGGKLLGDAFVKIQSIALEFWDENGIFHTVNMDLTAVFPIQTSLNKKVSQEIAHALSAMTWEEFSRGNPASTIKAVALDTIRKDPTGTSCSEVLVIKLMVR